MDLSEEHEIIINLLDSRRKANLTIVIDEVCSSRVHIRANF